jgi:DNA-binding NtrC family response regulator
LFGSKKGAFTGAHEDSAGLVEMAHGGTLVLDEINSLDIHSQVKLNYFLEKNYFRRLGETKLRHRDVRVISISNVDLRCEVQEGRFRRDLFYRLAEYEIFVPPLRSRKEDIVPLINHFLEMYSDLNTLGPITFSDKVLEELQSYDWPGNIRELKNFVKRCIIDAKTSVIENVSVLGNKKPSIPIQAASADSLPWRIAKKQAVASFETQYLKNLLKRYHGVVARCARHADMQTPDFWKLMRKYDIKADDFRTEA